MNILHMKYAAEVAKSGSLRKASEALLIAVPNISRSIRELEADLGITIFDRTSRGMRLTPQGEEFIRYAKSILLQIQRVEQLYKNGTSGKQEFSVSVPRADYIARAFVRFSQTLTEDAAEICYQETDSAKTIQNILQNGYRLGIVRHVTSYDEYFKARLAEKGLRHEAVADFTYSLLMSADHPLAGKAVVEGSDLADYIEILDTDRPISSLPSVQAASGEAASRRRIVIFERASRYALLSGNRETYMWAPSVSRELLERCRLVQKPCPDYKKKYRDLLIWRSNYRFTPLDRRFLAALEESVAYHF